VWWWLQKKISHTLTLISVVSMIVGYGFSYGLNTFIKTAVYTTSYDQENRLLRRLADPSVWPALLRTMVGQSWYLIATSLGLFGVAVFFIVARAMSVVRHKKEIHDPETTALLVMLLGTLAVIFTGGVQLLYGDRGDHLI
jgi:putative copper export protein